MKEHISITVNKETATRARGYAKQETRSVSQIFEMALEEYLSRRIRPVDQIVTSDGRFAGRFSRADTYGDR